MSEGKFQVQFSPNPIQQQFIESRARADLFSSRMGEGKSAGLVWSIFYHTRHNPGAKWLLIRDTWENLRRTTLEEFFKWFPAGVMGTYHQTHKTFTWAEGIARGSVEMIGMDDPDDAGKLQSISIAGAAMDEPAPAAASGGIDEMVFDIALSRLRQDSMNWYSIKLAENNPDESHWTYRRFVDPGTEGFRAWHPLTPENERNLPDNYYGDLRRMWSHRPDLARRFIEGKYGFQQIGTSVTPEWKDELHLSFALQPVRGRELVLLWDFGQNPTCLITQVTPLGHWNVLYSFVGDGFGVDQLCEDMVKPLLAERFNKFRWRHIGDPTGTNPEQSSASASAVRMLQRILGGPWRGGPVRPMHRIEPLRAVLTRVAPDGRGVVQVDKHNAPQVWHALRGGWHYHVAKTGVTSTEAVKDMHSHPGDAMSYGAAILFPTGRLLERKGNVPAEPAGPWSQQPRGPLGFERPGLVLPPEARLIIPR